MYVYDKLFQIYVSEILFKEFKIKMFTSIFTILFFHSGVLEDRFGSQVGENTFINVNVLYPYRKIWLRILARSNLSLLLYVLTQVWSLGSACKRDCIYRVDNTCLTYPLGHFTFLYGTHLRRQKELSLQMHFSEGSCLLRR